MEKLDTPMVVHVFNPSHDEALAHDRPQYCPSQAARRMGEALWDVARWWAAATDCILRLPLDGSLRQARFCIVADGSELAPHELPWDAVEAIEPWGWDRHITALLRRLGAPERLLPSEAQLSRIRQLSSRHTAVEVLRRLQTPFESRWCTTEADVIAAAKAFGGRAMLKQPWSCSGRGVWPTTMAELTGASSSILRVRKTLREQGAVEAEPVYDRVADFAMEFWAEPAAAGEGDDAVGCRVTYEGLSFFETHDGGAYAGNVVAPQPELRRRLEALAPPALLGADGRLPLDALAARLAATLATVLGADYRGPLGVDMMLTPAGIHPCIEVNLRNTMGRVAIMQVGKV